jgi:phosphatidylglycerophosphate synthase
MYKYYIDKYFSKKFVNLDAITYNPIMLLIYRITYPLSLLLNYFKIKPNTISFISFFFCLISLFFLVNSHSLYFSIFWILAIIFDFCDGTVARLSMKKTKLKFNLDHYLDLFKISLIIFFTSIKYDNSTIWIFSLLFIFLLFFNEVINFDLSSYVIYNKTSVTKSLNFPYVISKYIYTCFFTFNAHTLFLFVILVYNITFAKYLLLYLLSLLFKNLLINFYYLLKES